MTQVLKLKKGLDIKLKGAAPLTRKPVPLSEEVALVPSAFPGLTPKVVVHEGDKVKAGDALFVNKQCEDVRFASPASGVVSAVVRGERRKVLKVVIKTDSEQDYKDFGVDEPDKLSGDEVIEKLCRAGLFGFINQLPYDVSTTPAAKPKSIFVSALRDKPLASDFEFELQGGNAEAFQAGLTALSKIAPVHLGIGRQQSAETLRQAKNVDLTIYDGPCPAGNVGVQVNHTDPVNKGEVVWTVDPSAVIFFGRLFLTGKADLRRTVAVCGSEVKEPFYADVVIGQKLASLLYNNVKDAATARIINGNVLTGTKDSMDGYLAAHSSEVTVIPEGDKADEMLGWILPRTKQFSVSRSYFSWLQGKKKYDLDARVKGGQRHMIMSGEYDRVLPMDIMPEYLIKAIISGDIDQQEALGIYEVSPEDFALAEFVDSSKLELQSIVRRGLDILRKENM